MKQFGIDDKVIREINRIFDRYHQIKAVLIYGSRAKGNFRDGSDIDLTMKGDLGMTDLLKIENEIDELMLPYKVDLSIFHKLNNPDLIDHINRVGQVFYKP